MERCEGTADEGRARERCLSAAVACLRLESH